MENTVLILASLKIRSWLQGAYGMSPGIVSMANSLPCQAQGGKVAEIPICPFISACSNAKSWKSHTHCTANPLAHTPAISEGSLLQATRGLVWFADKLCNLSET